MCSWMLIPPLSEHVAQVQELSLVEACKDCPEVKEYCGMLDGLTFLPQSEVQQILKKKKTGKP